MFDADTEERRLILYLVEYKFGRTPGRAFPPYDDWRVSSPNTDKEDSELSLKEWTYKEELQELSSFQLQALYTDVRRSEDRACREERISKIRPSADRPAKQPRTTIIRRDHGAFREADERHLLLDELSALRQALQEANEERAGLREQVKKLQSKPANKSAETKVDNTKRRMIYGMARAKFALKPGSHYDSVATNIASALHRQGIDIDDDTVRNHLKDAIKLCEQPVAKEENPGATDL